MYKREFPLPAEENAFYKDLYYVLSSLARKDICYFIIPC